MSNICQCHLVKRRQRRYIALVKQLFVRVQDKNGALNFHRKSIMFTTLSLPTILFPLNIIRSNNLNFIQKSDNRGSVQHPSNGAQQAFLRFTGKK